MTKPGSPIIDVTALAKSFDGRPVLSGITLDIRRGETMVIMGGSGSGKSTLLRHLIGAVRPDSGTVKMFGKDIGIMPREELDEVRKRFGILFQSGALFNSMTIAQNVALPLEEHTDLDHDIIDIQVKIKLELVGLREHADKYPSQISGGMKKRAGLARALALDPEILFYDEPSAGLDPVTSAQIDQLIINLSHQLGVTSIVVTHEMDSAFTIADRMAMLDRGRMLRVDTRDWFDSVRKMDDDQAKSLEPAEQVIRQFLRGDPEGPFTQNRVTRTLEEDLLGIAPAAPIPSVQASR